jgi:hypothetical protein
MATRAPARGDDGAKSSSFALQLPSAPASAASSRLCLSSLRASDPAIIATMPSSEHKLGGWGAPPSVSTVLDPTTGQPMAGYAVSYASFAVARHFEVREGGGLLDEQGRPRNSQFQKLARVQRWRRCDNCGDAVLAPDSRGFGICLACQHTFRWAQAPAIERCTTVKQVLSELEWDLQETALFTSWEGRTALLQLSTWAALKWRWYQRANAARRKLASKLRGRDLERDDGSPANVSTEFRPTDAPVCSPLRQVSQRGIPLTTSRETGADELQLVPLSQVRLATVDEGTSASGSRGGSAGDRSSRDNVPSAADVDVAAPRLSKRGSTMPPGVSTLVSNKSIVEFGI